jgi:hypothetical protein
VFLHPFAQDFTCIRQILDLFAGASGLSTNLDKCTMTLIRCSRRTSRWCSKCFLVGSKSSRRSIWARRSLCPGSAVLTSSTSSMRWQPGFLLGRAVF